MSYKIGDRVYWWHTPTKTREGVIEDIDGTLGVRVDDGELVYVDPAIVMVGRLG